MSLVVVVLGLVAMVLLSQMLRQAMTLQQQASVHPAQAELARAFAARLTGSISLSLEPAGQDFLVRLVATGERGSDEGLVRDLGQWLWRRLEPEFGVRGVVVCLRHPDGGQDLERQVGRPPFLKPRSGSGVRIPG